MNRIAFDSIKPKKTEHSNDNWDSTFLTNQNLTPPTLKQKAQFAFVSTQLKRIV